MLHPSTLCLGFTFLSPSQNHPNFWHEFFTSAKSKTHKWGRTQLPTLTSHLPQSLRPPFHTAETLLLVWVWGFFPLSEPVLAFRPVRLQLTPFPGTARLHVVGGGGHRVTITHTTSTVPVPRQPRSSLLSRRLFPYLCSGGAAPPRGDRKSVV